MRGTLKSPGLIRGTDLRWVFLSRLHALIIMQLELNGNGKTSTYDTKIRERCIQIEKQKRRKDAQAACASFHRSIF